MTRVLAIRSVLVAAVIGSAWHFLRVVGSSDTFIFDDAFMFLRYAKHFLAGGGFSWNVTDGPAYGVSSALHLFVVTLLRALTSLTDQQVLLASSIGPAILSCAGLAGLGFFAMRDGLLRQAWVPLAIVPVLLSIPRFQFHSRTGMDTMLALLCNAILVWVVCAFVRSRSRRLLALSVVAAYLSYLARPDNVLVCVLFPPLFVLASDRRLRPVAMAYAACIAVVLAGDLFLKIKLFGDPIPLSFFAKRAGFYTDYLSLWRWNPVRYTLNFFTDCAPLLIVLVAISTREALPRILALLGPVLVTFAGLLGMVQIMGFGARLYYPFFPFVVASVFVALSEWPDVRAWRAAVQSSWGWRLALAAAVVLIWANPGDLPARAWQRYVIGHRAAPAATAVTTSTLADVDAVGIFGMLPVMLADMPAGTVLAASEHGYIGSMAPDIAIADLVGLHDRWIAHHGFSADYLLRTRRPDIIWFPPFDYAQMVKDLVSSPEFQRRYRFYPQAFVHGLALDRESPRYERVKMAADRAFARVYGGKRLDDYEAVSTETTAGAIDSSSRAPENRGARR